MQKFRKIYGVLPVLHTPFSDGDEIDHESLEREISWLAGLGVQGITTGMVSEILKLSPSERMALHEFVIESVGSSGLTTVLSAGAESTKQAIAYAKHAQDFGADAIMVNPPLTSSLDDDDLRRYFCTILNSTDIPMVVQDASGYIGRPLSLELQVKLLRDFEHRIYFKPEALPIGPRLSRFLEATEGRAKVLEGSGGLALIDTHARGVVGTMPGSDTAWALVALWKALEAGDQDRAEAISGPLANLNALEHSLDAYLAVEKYLMVKQGIFTSENRREPIGYRLDGKTKERIDKLFASLHRSVFREVGK